VELHDRPVAVQLDREQRERDIGPLAPVGHSDHADDLVEPLIAEGLHVDALAWSPDGLTRFDLPAPRRIVGHDGAGSIGNAIEEWAIAGHNQRR
jgi:hypothetical protein